MVEHSRVRELFSDYLEGELADDLARELDSHLEGCEDCRKELQSLKQTVAAVSSLGPVQAPEGFTSKVHLRLRRRMRHRPEMASTLEHKIPYETICLIMLAILAALYIILYLMPLMDVDMSYQDPEGGLDRGKPARKEDRKRKKTLRAPKTPRPDHTPPPRQPPR
jgi:predicted anti-sigma-YlaC factor YlaD